MEQAMNDAKPAGAASGLSDVLDVVMTAEDRVLHYIRWHALAYGAPAPMDEITEKLGMMHGLTETQSHDLLVRLRKEGLIAYKEGRFSGWHEVATNGLLHDKAPNAGHERPARDDGTE